MGSLTVWRKPRSLCSFTHDAPRLWPSVPDVAPVVSKWPLTQIICLSFPPFSFSSSISRFSPSHTSSLITLDCIHKIWKMSDLSLSISAIALLRFCGRGLWSATEKCSTGVCVPVTGHIKRSQRPCGGLTERNQT